MLESGSWEHSVLQTPALVSITFNSLMVLVWYIFYFKYTLLDILMASLTLSHKGHAASVLVPIYMCTDCQHMEIIQTKS